MLKSPSIAKDKLRQLSQTPMADRLNRLIGKRESKDDYNLIKNIS